MIIRGRTAGICALALAGTLSIAGCGGDDEGSTSGAASPSLGESALPGLLATVDWPDDEATIAAVFDDLPEELSGLARFHPPPGPESAPQTSAYYGEPNAVGIALYADPGNGTMTSAEGIANLVAYPRPQTCVDADYSPLFADLFQSTGGDAVQREVRRLSEVPATRGELLWVICTKTADEGDDVDTPIILPEDEWRYVAGWADGGWLYLTYASSADQRTNAVAALTKAVQRADTG